MVIFYYFALYYLLLGYISWDYILCIDYFNIKYCIVLLYCTILYYSYSREACQPLGFSTGELDDPMIRAAKENAKAKKERKEAALSAKTKAKAARQYHPENKIEVGGLFVFSGLWVLFWSVGISYSHIFNNMIMSVYICNIFMILYESARKLDVKN